MSSFWENNSGIYQQNPVSPFGSIASSSNPSEGFIDIDTALETDVVQKGTMLGRNEMSGSRILSDSTGYPLGPSSRNHSTCREKMSWKSDPDTSFSDWTIEILVRETQQRQLFYLHRNIVGFGPRKSNFFKDAFLRHRPNNKDTNVTKLMLPENQAKVFPMVLDYIYYTREARQTLTSSRACAMYKIANHLVITSLEKAIVEFYSKNTTLENVSEYFNSAKEADAPNLIIASKAKIGSMILKKPELGGLVPPNFLVEIFEVYRQQSETSQKKNQLGNADVLQSKILSKAAYLCISKSKSSMNTELFDKLTNEKVLPIIDVYVALSLLNLSAHFGEGGFKYTSLQKRCVKSVTKDWSKFQKQYSSRNQVSSALKRLPSHVLADILVMTMDR